MTDRYVALLAIGFIAGTLLGALRKPWLKWRYQRRYRTPARPAGPPQPLAADMIRYARWKDEQILRALRDEPPTPTDP